MESGKIMESNDKEKQDLIDKVNKFSNLSESSKSYNRKADMFLFGSLACLMFCFGNHIVNFSFLKGLIVSFVVFAFIKLVNYLSVFIFFWDDFTKLLEEYKNISK